MNLISQKSTYQHSQQYERNKGKSAFDFHFSKTYHYCTKQRGTYKRKHDYHQYASYVKNASQEQADQSIAVTYASFRQVRRNEYADSGIESSEILKEMRHTIQKDVC